MKYQPYPNDELAWKREITIEVDKAHTDYLARFTTRYLMRIMKEARATGFYSPYNGMEFSQAEIKFVLDNREHVPNKIEARNIRREKAKRR